VIGESGPLPNSDSEHFDVEIGNHSVLEAGSRVEGGDHTRQGPTLLGAHVLIHGGAHLGPGCTVGDQAILSPGVILDAGVRLETAVTLGAGVYVRGGRSIGTHARVASLSCVFRDVPPFVVVAGRPARVRGLHLSALKHIGAAEPEIAALREAVRLLFRSKLSPDHAADRLAEHHLASPRVQQLLSFVRTHDLAIRPSTRSLRTSRSHP
jgi:UDP-N-acetylglucosamine acyltransferase